jgi:8-oxo-dGTP diphosphatase
MLASWCREDTISIMSYTYSHPHPAVTVDCVVFGYDTTELKVLLIRRKLDPFRGRWALPGGFVQEDETLEDAARRELSDETGMSKLFLEQLYSFGDPDRDPRERVISIAYYALTKLADHALKAASDADDAAWFAIADLPKLGFDHEKIIDTALRRLKAKVRYEPIGFELLAEKFSLGELQRLYETVLEQPLDKRNFRKKILGMELLEALDEYQRDVAHRAAQYYRFNRARYDQLKRRGFNFEL